MLRRVVAPIAVVGFTLCFTVSCSTLKEHPTEQALDRPTVSVSSRETADEKNKPHVDTAEAELLIAVSNNRTRIEPGWPANRNVDTHVEVITAEDIGKMPDKNLCEEIVHLLPVTISASPAYPSALEQKRQAVNNIDVIINDDDDNSR